MASRINFSGYAALIQRFFPEVQSVWLQAALLLIIFIVLAKIIQLTIDKIVLRFAAKTRTKIDDLLVERTKNPLFYLVLFVGLRLAVIPLQLGNATENTVESIGIVFFLYLLSISLTIIIDSWGKKFARKTKTSVDETLTPLVSKTTKVFFFIIAIIWILDVWQINITPYLAGLGIGGIVIGFALQDSLKNVFGGVSLILDRSFNIGDKIQLESGELGEILDIGLRSTKLKTYDNEIIFIPNGQLANMKIHNFVQPNTRVRVVVDFSVEYGTKVPRVQKVVLETLKKMKKVSSRPYMDVIMVEMGDFALKFKARFWVDDYKLAYDKKIEATKRIYAALNKAKIGIPFPTRTVYMKKEK